MNIAETISVNPVSKTLGALHPEATLSFLKNNRTSSIVNNNKRKSRSSLLFGTSYLSEKKYGAALLFCRLLFSALLIISGSFILSGEILPSTYIIDSFYLGLGEIIAGSMLALGLLSRFVMGSATLFFGYVAIISIMSGIFDMQALLCCMSSLVFFIMGAGKYSCDFLIRKSILLRSIRHQKKIREQRLSYRAYRIHNM